VSIAERTCAFSRRKRSVLWEACAGRTPNLGCTHTRTHTHADCSSSLHASGTDVDDRGSTLRSLQTARRRTANRTPTHALKRSNAACEHRTFERTLRTASAYSSDLPHRTAIFSAFCLPNALALARPHAYSLSVSTVPAVVRCDDIRTGDDECGDGICVTMERCQHERSPPAAPDRRRRNALPGALPGPVPYPSLVLAARSAPVAMRCSTTCI
jgi:hypothetical protein